MKFTPLQDPVALFGQDVLNNSMSTNRSGFKNIYFQIFSLENIVLIIMQAVVAGLWKMLVIA